MVCGYGFYVCLADSGLLQHGKDAKAILHCSCSLLILRIELSAWVIWAGCRFCLTRSMASYGWHSLSVPTPPLPHTARPAMFCCSRTTKFNLWPEHKHLNFCEFANVLQGGRQQDSQELLCALLDGLKVVNLFSQPHTLRTRCDCLL